MDTSEIQWDKLLNIKTTGRDDSNADQFRYPYEPTPYVVLERLANSGWIGKKSILLDYGCGKGRVDYYLSYQLKCHTIGIEYDKRIYDVAMANMRKFVSKDRCTFVQIGAEEYTVPTNVGCCYFFNPFSNVILQKVLSNVYQSFYEAPRNIVLFFYYPSDEYVTYLMTQRQLLFMEEIDCMDLFPGNDDREKILVFEVIS